MAREFRKVRDQIKSNKNNNEKTLIIIYVGGHGVIKLNKTYIMLNTNDNYESYFDIEQKIRDLSQIDQTYLLAILDCCRDNFDFSFGI